MPCPWRPTFRRHTSGTHRIPGRASRFVPGIRRRKDKAPAATGREGIPVTVEVEGRCRLPTEVHVALYRIAQEALNNVVKHAHASRATVTLRMPPPADQSGQPSPPHAEGIEGRQVELGIGDDGRGFDPARTPSDRLGLGIMRERAQAIGAKLTIDSRPGLGTTVRVIWTAGQAPAEGG